ncbi:Guanine nucleotide-binding protein subunit beta [Hordeum vulgare]|nr:Guanine nucleotide-binding protein subunit beta [Hordeum vulgare]
MRGSLVCSSIEFSRQGRVGVALQDWAPTKVVQFEEDEILVLGFDREMPLCEHVLAMDFTGTLNDQMTSFYRSKYEYNGEARNMAVT